MGDRAPPGGALRRRGGDLSTRESALPEAPLVSVVIPVKDGAERLPACLESLRRLDWPAHRLEVIVADGRSRDATRDLAAAMGARVVDNPRCLVAAGRNVGFDASRGDVVAFTDDDCTFDPGWLRGAVRQLRDPAIAGVGGPTLVPDDETPFGKAVAVFFRLGVRFAGSVHAETVDAERDVDDLPGCNMIYRREALARVMPAPETLVTAEDVELGFRLRGLGFRLRCAPDVRVWHHKRSTPGRFLRQMKRFAQGRVQLSRRRKGVLRPAHVAAGLALPALGAALVLLAWLRPEALLVAPAALAALWLVLLAATRSVGLSSRAVIAVVGGLAAWSYGFTREWLFPVTTDEERFDWQGHSG